MNEEAQRIAIANACNWTQHGDEGVYGCWDDPNQITRTDCPDYLNDLNAMHEAEKALDPHVRNDFIAHLWSVTGNEPSANFWTEYNFRGLYACTHATARQRAEAFLRTIGKWEDGK